jgi:hypothetical protein
LSEIVSRDPVMMAPLFDWPEQLTRDIVLFVPEKVNGVTSKRGAIQVSLLSRV